MKVKGRKTEKVKIDCKKFVSYKKKFLKGHRTVFSYLYGLDDGNKEIHKFKD